MNKKLLYIGAHPGDETFNVGGTLAYYASRGIEVYYACATRGEAGSVPSKSLEAYSSVGDLRWAELECAAGILGLKQVISLHFRDSGMLGSPDNEKPTALVNSPLDEVAGRIVGIIRHIRPDVVITFDPTGGNGHIDHIFVSKATAGAFYNSANSMQYPEAGEGWQPKKLYFQAASRRQLRLWVKLMPLFDQDPKHLGRNKDIDITALASMDFPVHASVKLDPRALNARDRAIACYTSQKGAEPGPDGILKYLSRFYGHTDLYLRSYPSPDNSRPETDLFAGV